jgi:hypothetical protein
MALSMTEIFFNTPLSAVGLYLTYTSSPIQPWKGWADAHFDYAAVNLVRGFLWRSKPAAVLALELSRWSPVFCAFLFFAFFGFADEARRNYQCLYLSITKRLGSMTSKGMGYGSTRSAAPPPVLFSTYLPQLFRSKGSQRMTVQSSYPGSLPVFVRHSLDLPKSGSFAYSDRPFSVEKSHFSLYSSHVTADCSLQSTTTIPPSPSSSLRTQYDISPAVDPTLSVTSESHAHTPSPSPSRTCSFLQHPTPELVTHHPTIPESLQRSSTFSSTFSCPEGFDTIEPVSCITTDSLPLSFRPSSSLSHSTHFDTIYVSDGLLPRAL